ncbi:hypothetical protein ACOME3_003377 [Neoechinorhynchus agilis]
MGDDFINFSSACPTQYHLLDECIKRLADAGFQELKLSESWNIENGKSYYVKKLSGLYAFNIGRNYAPGNGMALTCGQIDAPGLILKPISDRGGSTNFSRLGIAIYGTPNLHTWFDRDLTIAGRVFVRKSMLDGRTKIQTNLIYKDMPMAKIPSLAIHFDRTVNDEFKFNGETELIPIYGKKDAVDKKIVDKENQKLETPRHSKKETEKDWFFIGNDGQLIGYLDDVLNFNKPKDVVKETQPLKSTGIKDILASMCQSKAEDIVDFDLNLVDRNPYKSWSTDFVSGSRMESIATAYSMIQSLINTERKDHGMIQAVVLVEATENTSQASYGAGSRFIKRLFSRIVGYNDNNFAASISRSCFACVSGALAANPNYPSYYEVNHMPRLNAGPVILYANRVNFITNSFSALIANMVATRNSLKIQNFLCRNWKILFTSVGTAFGLNLGMNGFDIGIPILANGSIRETSTLTAIKQMEEYLKKFYSDFGNVMEMME